MSFKISVGALSLVTLAIIYLSGCSTSSSSGSGSGYANKTIEYSINGFEITSNADEVVDSAEKDGITKNLFWGCGNYNGRTGISVSLVFQKTDTTWDFQTDIISHGICN